ncbi:LacI family DNA-binding transcriptional regulator [Paenibacillus ginsengarvi]|uniref:LacI family transcriptional regulator n=1 Tax=Paenibacillus ginsengarvi TaxID=400777 RepID=A0A3B0CDU6_9BACL|nr:LacI family DNA-binding transcriptional regulator [Paenibacillus ginsengarvi]RKN84305.1 LacI family transcriptional regulator [Paenibacillus ginsengarvi]
MQKRKAVTLQDIAAKTGLSIQTISKALRGMPGMSEQSRHHIFQLAKEMGYRSKEQEQAHTIEHIPLRSSKTYRFKLIVSARTDSYDMNPLILDGLQKKMIEYGHTVEQIALASDDSLSIQQWVKLHQLEYCDGLFLTPTLPTDQIDYLLTCAIPRVLIHFPTPRWKVDSVIWDAGTAVYQSVQYLLAQGHRRVLYVGELDTAIRGFVMRWDAFRMAMAEHGIEAREEEHLIHIRGLERDMKIQHLLDQVRERQATAVLCGVSYHLPWVYQACTMSGLRIPEDVSLISLEDTVNAYIPELSRPLLLIRESGARAAERMLWRIANPNAPYEHTMLQGDFYKGATVVSCV